VCAPASENPFLPDWPNLLVVAHEWGSTMPPVPTADPVEPATERVRLDQVIGRTLPGDAGPVRELRWNVVRGRFQWSRPDMGAWLPLDVAPDGTVEVRKANQ
jgi:hypothetical protein